MVRIDDEEIYYALSDNGYGARMNSADFQLGFHRMVLAPSRPLEFNADGTLDFAAQYRATILLRDPHRLLPFAIVHDDDPQRILTGADLDPESMQRLSDGTLWIGDEFGPYLLHFDETGVLLDPPFSPPHPDDPTRILRSPDHPDLRETDPDRAEVAISAGFEALALEPESGNLFAILERPLKNDLRRTCFAFEFDPRTKAFTGRRIELPLAAEAVALADAQFLDRSRILAIERDDAEGSRAAWKKLIAFDLARDAVSRREIADLLNIATRDTLAPDTFSMPFLTIEALAIRPPDRLWVVNDNNYPFSSARGSSGEPDDTEFVQLQVEEPLQSLPLGSPSTPIRFATFNASLNRPRAGQLLADLVTKEDTQARQVAEILQTVRPDVVLLNEFDRDPVDPKRAIRYFLEEYVAVSQNGREPIVYPYWFAPETNTGEPSGVDLDRNGKVGGEGRDHGGDALGYGDFPGQYGFVVLSRLPLGISTARTFRTLKWKDVPGTLLPDDKATPEPRDWYSPQALDVLPLSSKNHVDITVLGRHPIHLLLSHPTPPAFDGPEDRNGLRNAAEIRFWLDYLTPGQGDWIVDDLGRRGGLAESESCVVLGDLNSDPFDGNSRRDMIRMLLAHARLQDPEPRSAGAQVAATSEGFHGQGDPALHTADFASPNPGNLRVDYVLPSKDCEIVDSGVFWPTETDSSLSAVSDHHLVYVTLRLGHAPPR